MKMYLSYFSLGKKEVEILFCFLVQVVLLL